MCKECKDYQAAIEEISRLQEKIHSLRELVERCVNAHDGGDSFTLRERDDWMRDANKTLSERAGARAGRRPNRATPSERGG